MSTAPGHYPDPGFQQPAPRGRSIAALVLGIASLPFGFLLPLPSVAILLGVLARRREPWARGMATAGLVLGIVGLAIGLFVAWALLIVIAIVVNQSRGNVPAGLFLGA